MNDAEMFSEPRALAAGSVRRLRLQQLKLKLSRLRRLNDADRWEIRVITGVCGRLPADARTRTRPARSRTSWCSHTNERNDSHLQIYRLEIHLVSDDGSLNLLLLYSFTTISYFSAQRHAPFERK